MLAEPGDDRQQVVEVVGHAAGQAPDHLELLRLSEGLLEAPALGPGGLLLRHVLAHARQQQPLAILAHDRKSAGAHPAQLSVRSQDAQLLIEARRVGPALETGVEAPAVVGVDRVGPGVRALVEGFRRAAPDALVGTIDEHRPKRLGLGDADGVIEVLEHLAKALLAHVEGGLRGHAVGHVLRERRHPSGAARGDQLERLVIDPAHATVAALDAVVDRLGPLALGDHRPVVRMDGLEQSRGRLAGEVRARPSPKQVEGGAQIDDLAGVRVLEPEHLTDPPGELADRVPGAAQSILGAVGRIELLQQLAPVAAQLEQGGHLVGQGLQRAPLVLCQVARLAVEHAQRPEVVAALHLERDARVEADVGIIGHQRELLETRVGARVGDHEGLLLLGDRVGAEGQLARDLLLIDAQARLEPLALGVDERHQRNRRVADLRRQLGDLVELRFPGRIENLEAKQLLEPLVLIRRYGKGAQSEPASRAAREYRSGCGGTPLAGAPLHRPGNLPPNGRRRDEGIRARRRARHPAEDHGRLGDPRGALRGAQRRLPDRGDRGTGAEARSR